MQKNKEAIIHHLATKYNLPLSKVKEIVEYQFKFVTQTMKKGKFETVRLPYFGKFTVKSKRLEYIKKLSKNAKKKQK
jgi:nucleoid DNA-binding protein|tara:strand:+ start:1634 stop:1864 length:231 start_codon:yes stop_codon:yes gene_type:complete